MSDRDEQRALTGRESLAPTVPEEARLESLLVAFDEALARGGAAGVTDESELSDASAVKLNGMRKALRLLEQARFEGLSSEGLADESAADLLPIADTPLVKPSLAGQKIGRFELVGEIGRGGYGVVFLAVDPQIGRQVALKIPRPEILANEETKRRFFREAKAAGALEHPNLIPVYEVGEDGPFCYLATAYCQGPTLAQWLKQRNTSTPPRLAARLVLGLAQGVDHAHQRGVLHRDIKPSNVLLEGAAPSTDVGVENLVPRLTDFGLAKLTEMAEDETRSGALLGTPAYMAPEQAEGRLRDIGPPTDIYALGVLLYELLACRPPFRGESDVQTLQLVSAGDVPSLRRVQRNLPRDLEAIVLRCLERDPARRYATASDLAADLQRFLDGKPTVAQPATPAERLLKSARRHPAVASMVVVLCLAGGLLAIEHLWYSRQVGAARAEVEEGELERGQLHYVADMTNAYRALSTNQVQQARESLAPWLAAQPDLQDFASRYLWQQLNGQELTLTGHEGEVHYVCYSPDGTRLATASADRTVRVWDAADGHCLLVLQGHEGEVNCVAFSPNGQRLVSTSDDGTLREWNLTDGTTLHVTPGRAGPLWGVAFSPDGTLLAVCGEDKNTVLWDTRDWQLLETLGEHSNQVGALAFSHDGKWLATVSEDGLAIVWDVATRNPVHRLKNNTALTSVSFDPQDQRLIVGGRAGRCTNLWDLRTGKLLLIGSTHHEIVHAVAFHPQKNYFAVATKGGVVELHDASTGDRFRNLHGHAMRVWSLAFSPNGERLATASADRTVKIWNLSSENPRSLAIEKFGSRCLDVTPDGRRLVTGHENGAITVYDLPTRNVVWHTRRDFEVVGDFDGDGARDQGYFVGGVWRIRLAASGRDPKKAEFVRMFGLEDQVPLVCDWDGDGTDDLGVYDSKYQFFGQLPEGVTASTYGPITSAPERVVPFIGRWHGVKADRLGVASFQQGTWSIRFSRPYPEGRLRLRGIDRNAYPVAGRWHAGAPNQFGMMSADGWWMEKLKLPPRTKPNFEKELTVKFSTKPLTRLDQPALDAAHDLGRSQGIDSQAITVAISPAGDHVAVSLEDDRRVHIWDVPSGLRTAVVTIDSSKVERVAYSPDGRILTVAHEDGQVTEFDAQRLNVLDKFRAHEIHLNDIAYSHDGNLLATTGFGGEVKLWNRQRKLVRQLTESGHDQLWGLAFSADDRLLAAGGQDRTARIWDLRSGREMMALVGNNSGINKLAFSPDGRLLATVDDDGTLRLWDLATRQQIGKLQDQPQRLLDVAFSPDGQDLIASGLSDASAVLIWSAPKPPNSTSHPNTPLDSRAELGPAAALLPAQ
jgi:WD40 repeat protein/tRNA A-37 threonylcarbamoyl transferase component Bud32